jgi:large subunit ribosomal protein L19e
MNLRKKKELASKTFGVGKKRIVFIESRKDDIKEAITKQDLRDLAADGAITIKDIKGRTKVEKRKNQRRKGKIKKTVNTRKKDYVALTRKLRAYLVSVKEIFGLEKEDIKEIRKKIRNKKYRSKANLREYLEEIKK